MANETENGWQDKFLEFLLPTGSFAKDGTERKQHLRDARWIIFWFYVGFTGVFLYTVIMLFFSGRVEVMQTGYKMDMIEAPSMAICPFNALDQISKPKGDLVEVFKYGINGEEKLDCMNKETDDCVVSDCVYDRECICVDMRTQKFHDHIQRDVEGVGTTGVRSKGEEMFRERFQVTLLVRDTSPDKTLKIGFYDSIDHAPNWFYASQGGYTLGQLELQTWTVTDLTWGGARDTLEGDLTAMGKQRHIFRYTSQEVARGSRGADDTRVSYEMKNFFVDDTVAAESAFSPYTLIFLIFLIVVRSAVIQIFINIMFPEWKENQDKITIRQISPQAESATTYCGCFCGHCSLSCFSCCWPWGKSDATEAERQPISQSP